ncbi:hypothetical protein STRCI_005212 [Streptomyces cinnabarinus]|uniref:Uncharacterized protein n=1 Tax=Streptomyces cinnabarinus TaxID=67287 RepID=A0ABY7KL66_9ACTN|nr:hypothetical protein [Streptomyces cinnabarinus]WAZ23842.1 hypothetical protein STRCI_005212 [Streptomyces cinnabarinus]
MSTAPTIVVDDSAEDPDAEFWFAEPPGFLPLPLDALLPEPDSTAAHALRTAAEPFLNAAPDELLRQQLIAQVASGQQLLAALREIGTVHCSIGLHRDDVGGGARPLFSLFTVSWRRTATVPRGVMAARAVSATSVTQGGAYVEYLELPCGPATVSESTSALSAAVDTPLLQLRAHLPHPDCKRLAVLTLGTTALARRDEYRVILRQIAETVSFEKPFGPVVRPAAPG